MAFSSSWIGLAGMLAQILLLRLVLARADGNELSLGIVSALFLLSEAFGAWAAEIIARHLNAKKLLALLTVLFAASMPLSLLVLGLARPIFGLAPGEILGLPLLTLLALVISILPGISHGASFTVLCRVFVVPGPGRIFAWESAGTLAGGIVFSLWLVRCPNELTALSVLIFGAGIALAPLATPKKTEGTQPLFAMLFCLVLAGLLVVFKAPLNDWILDREFPGEILASRQSPYATMVLSRIRDQSTLYLNGSPYLVFPEPDPGSVEESAHIPLLFHPDPRRILVIGTGPGSFVEEVLRHGPVRQVDLIEMDPAPGELLKNTVHPACLDNPSFHLINTDARLFLASTRDDWDLIFLRISDIDSFQVQRLFTVEAFARMRQHLHTDGLISLEFDSSFPYIPSEEIRKLAVIRAALGTVFPRIREIPGEHYRLLAGGESAELSLTVHALIRRISLRNLQFRVLSPAALRYLLAPPLSPPPLPPAEANRDFQALSLRAEILLWCSRYSPRTAKILEWIRRIPTGLLFVFALLPLAPGLVKKRQTSVIITVVAAGFLAMVAETVLAIAFQIAAGALYGRLALLLASFMGGSALGAAWASNRKAGIRHLRTSAFVMFVLHLCLLPLLKTPAFPLFWFSLLSGLSGGISGTIYPFAVDTIGRERAGSLYAAEITGGFAGGILGVILILVRGLRPTLGLASLALFSAAVSLKRFRE